MDPGAAIRMSVEAEWGMRRGVGILEWTAEDGNLGEASWSEIPEKWTCGQRHTPLGE